MPASPSASHSQVRLAAEESVQPALTASLSEAEHALSELRVKLDAERYARRAAEGRVATAEQEALSMRAREEKLDLELSQARAKVLEHEVQREAERREFERVSEFERLYAADQEASSKQLASAEQAASSHADNEAKLLSECEAAKRAQAEAERVAMGLQNTVRQLEARVLAADQRVEDAHAANLPLRQQAQHAATSVAAFEARLRESSERLAQSETRGAELHTTLLQVSEVEARQRDDAVAEAEGQLAQARAEISGWAARQQLLLSQLNAERDTGHLRSAQLVEAQEALSSMRQLIVAAKEEELADAHRELRSQQESLAEVTRRAERSSEQLGVAREELKLRAEQQRLLLEKLRDAEEALRAKEQQLNVKGEVNRAHQLRADGAAERLVQASGATSTLQSQLGGAYDKIAALSKDVEVARARERRAVDEAVACKAERDNLEADLATARARVDALGEKVRVSREARISVQQTLEQRESQLEAARRELADR